MTVPEAAEYLSISPQRVRALIEKKKLSAVKHGRDWWIEKRILETFAQQERPAHRPKRV